MYWLNPEIKRDPKRRWELPDRIFFGYGACHILAGACLDRPPLRGFHAEKITPDEGFSGNHVIVTDGTIAFDFHGYTVRERLLGHFWRGWRSRYPGWSANVDQVDYDLLDTSELNARKMLGPDQYLHSALGRARNFITRIDHASAYRKARSFVLSDPVDVGGQVWQQNVT